MKIKIQDPNAGHITKELDVAVEEERSLAEELFGKYIIQGVEPFQFVAFATDAEGVGTVVKEFPAEAASILIIPQISGG